MTIDRLRVDRGGTRVLHDLSLQVSAGRITGLLGPSGCGKTTLMRAIVGVQIVAGGCVEVLGLPAGSASLRHRVGYVTQAPSVYGDLTVTENMDGPLRPGSVVFVQTPNGVTHRDYVTQAWTEHPVKDVLMKMAATPALTRVASARQNTERGKRRADSSRDGRSGAAGRLPPASRRAAGGRPWSLG